MIPLAYTPIQTELTYNLMSIERNLLESFADLVTFEAFLLAAQREWDEPNVVKRVIALHKVEARVSLTSEAVDGFVRVELQDGSRENWHFYYLKEGGLSVPPFEDFWLEPVGSEGNQNAVC